jgi:hypothetical protein
MTIERPMFPRATPTRVKESCVAGCILATKRADYFVDLETPMRELSAMVEVVMMVWRHPELGKVEHDARVDVVLDKLELMTQGMIDDYRAKLEVQS